MRSVRVLAGVALTCLLAACAAPGDKTDQTIDDIFARFDRPGSPGCAVGVYRAGEVVLARAFGFADLEHSTPLTPDTIFDIASNSKQFTALALRLLERDALLSLDDDVHRYVPELPDFGMTITLRHLVHNTSGLRDLGDLLEVVGSGIDEPVDREDFLALLARMKTLNFRPGERYMYSNTNFILLALVVERVDGRPFREFLQDEIFVPLGMHETTLRDDPTSLIPRRALAYRPVKGGGYRENFSWGRATGLAGMGFIHSTLHDLARWDANFYTGKVGGEGIAELMYTRGTLDSGGAIAYASGLIVGRQRDLAAVWHGGQGGGSSELMRFPERRLSVAILCNLAYPHADAHDLALRIADHYLDEPRESATSAGTPVATADPAERYAATYWIEEQVRRTTFVAKGHSLAELFDGEEYELKPTGKGRFEDDYEAIVFSPDGQSATGTTLATGETYTLVRLPEWSPTLAESSSYAGVYVSPEFGAALSVQVAENELALEGRSGRRVLEALRPDAFTLAGGLIEFRRDDLGEVDGLLLSSDRLVDLEFLRQDSMNP